MQDDPRFDGLFMSAIQQCQGIENFYSHLFSFMRRKTDFFSQEDKSTEVVMRCLKAQQALFADDKQRQNLIKAKQAEMHAKKAAA